MKKLFLVTNLVVFLAILIGDVLFIETGSLLAKGLASACFVLLGGINLIYALKNKSDKKFCIIMLIGLIFGMLGDILLEIEFITGAILFAIGHVIYFVAYCFLEKLHWADLVGGAIVFVSAALVILFVPIFDFGGNTMKILCLVYALFISLMLGKSAVNFFRNRNMLNVILLVGSILFFFSDLMLLINNFSNVMDYALILCLSTYYPAQTLLAFSLLNTSKK